MILCYLVPTYVDIFPDMGEAVSKTDFPDWCLQFVTCQPQGESHDVARGGSKWGRLINVDFDECIVSTPASGRKLQLLRSTFF